MNRNYNTVIQIPANDKQDFEQLYTDVRKKEKRLYNLHEVAVLPEIRSSHIHYNEWKVRKRSSLRLVDYLKKKNTHLKILEVGCGNGWLSNKIACNVDAEVIGIDINKTELSQARTVWGHTLDLDFKYGNIKDIVFKHNFDVIIFAASIQYFKSLPEILSLAISLLNKGGEIHILDTRFYVEEEVLNAFERTKKYYSELGYPEMSDHYFHHSWQQLEQFNYTVLYDPQTFIHKLLIKKNIFPWIKITR